ncbi:MAG: hypothetical protein R3F60_23200 [bacterium]
MGALRRHEAAALAAAGDVPAALAALEGQGPEVDGLRVPWLLEREDLDAALAALERLPSTPETLLLRARARHTLADAEGARQAARAAESDAATPAQLRSTAEVWLLLEEPAAASRVLGRALARDPEDAAALRLRARALWRQGDAAGARVDAARAGQLAPLDPAGRRLLAALRLADGDDLGGRALLAAGPDRAVLGLAPAGDFATALVELDAAAQAATPAERAPLALMALAIALRLEGPTRLEARAAHLGVGAGLPWLEDLGRVVRGEAEASILGGRLRQHRARVCEATLALGARAHLAGDRVGAADQLAQSRDGDPDDLPCALARSLARRTLLVQGTKP